MKARACLACYRYKVTCVPVRQETPWRCRVRKGQEASEVEPEVEGVKQGEEMDAGTERSGGQEEVVGRLQVLEQKVNISEVLLRTLLRD